MNTSVLPDQIELKAKFFRGFSDTSRLSIIEFLRDGEQTVGDIVQKTGLSQSNVSNHLRCLYDCGLVANRRDGRKVWYRLSDSRINKLLSLSEQLLADSARGVYECTRLK